MNSLAPRWRTSLIWAWTAAVVIFMYLPGLCLLLASMTSSRYFIFPITKWVPDLAAHRLLRYRHRRHDRALRRARLCPL